jgi:tetratricopeptide (TPR) repeat protein
MKPSLQKRKWPARRRFSVALVILLGLAGMVGAQKKTTDETSTTKLQQMFLEAGQAYDANRPADAAALYGKLVEQGYESKELYFNLGNAFFKSGKLGQAILNYRRAWYLAPRDPDIQANLRFALQSASASAPDLPLPVKLLFKVSLSEWMVLATCSYWASAIALALFLLTRNQRDAFARAFVLSLALLILSAAGVVNALIARRSPELVVIEPNQQVLYAPLEGSKAYFALPEGSIVRLKEQAGTWFKVTTGRQSGYIQSKACAPVEIR